MRPGREAGRPAAGGRRSTLGVIIPIREQGETDLPEGRTLLEGDSARSHRLQAGSYQSRESQLESEREQAGVTEHTELGRSGHGAKQRVRPVCKFRPVCKPTGGVPARASPGGGVGRWDGQAAFPHPEARPFRSSDFVFGPTPDRSPWMRRNARLDLRCEQAIGRFARRGLRFRAHHSPRRPDRRLRPAQRTGIGADGTAAVRGVCRSTFSLCLKTARAHRRGHAFDFHIRPAARGGWPGGAAPKSLRPGSGRAGVGPTCDESR